MDHDLRGRKKKRHTHTERAAAEHPEGDVIIPIKSWTHLALPAASRQRNSSEAGGKARHASTCTSCKGLMRKKKRKTSGWRGFVKAPAPRGTRNVR